jgi:hypothetical protein
LDDTWTEAKLAIATGHAMQFFNDLHYSNHVLYLTYLDADLLA